jgi:hypothetical protein
MSPWFKVTLNSDSVAYTDASSEKASQEDLCDLSFEDVGNGSTTSELATPEEIERHKLGASDYNDDGSLRE